MSNLYWVAVLEEAKKTKKEDESKLPKLIIEPVFVVAKDDKCAALSVIMDNVKLKGKDPNKLQVIIRPF